MMILILLKGRFNIREYEWDRAEKWNSQKALPHLSRKCLDGMKYDTQ